MNIFSKIKDIFESSKTYTSGTGYSARVISKNNKHVAKFFKDDKHMVDADYVGSDEKDAHEFAHDEMEFRKNNANMQPLVERRIPPQGYKESGNPIEDNSKEHENRPDNRINKMMGRQGNVTSLDIITRLLAGKK